MTDITAGGWWGQWWASIDWGNAPEWVGAVATVLGLGVALFTYIWSVSISRKSQARKVVSKVTAERLKVGDEISAPFASPTNLSVTISTNQTPARIFAAERAVAITIEVTNDSDEIMGPIRADLIPFGTSQPIQGAHGDFQMLRPRSSDSQKITIRDEWHPLLAVFAARIVFRDSAGRWWQRHGSAPVVRASRRIRPEPTDAPARRRARRTIAGDPPHPSDKASGWMPIGRIK